MISERPSSPTLTPELPASSAAPRPARRSRLLRALLTVLVILLGLAAIFADTLTSGAGWPFIAQRFQTFVTIFLGIFIEAVPFLLAGSLVSGFIAVFVDDSMIERYMPRRALPGALAGASMGLLFPVCECGVVPVTRRLYEKGLPTSIGVAFLLAAPVINPIVIISTYAAFGATPVFWGRLVVSALVAVIVGLIFAAAQAREVLLPNVAAMCGCSHAAPTSLPVSVRVRQSLNTAGDDFLDMVRYLIIGSMLAAAMQTLVPQALLLSVGQGPVVSVLVMQALAFVLSICSTVDAFLALAFAGTFTTGSIVAFLTFGPMVDIKSALMFLGVFQRRVVAYLIVLPLLLTMFIGILWNLYLL
jgi:uncharacterized membrane protein YraQ (UPF0718 family)